ncbi:MAG: S41 family peptidase [Patescibacteria group bacterium]|nr:S41 family peptidase [Patescibacteria group bacterium]
MVSQKKVVILLVIAFIIGFLFGDSSFQQRPSKSLSSDTSADVYFDNDLFWHVWSTLKENYVKQPIEDKDLFYGALKGLVMGIDDPYSVFLKPELAKKFIEDMAGSFEGVGMELGVKDGHLTVIAPLPDTPAFRAGIRSGDKIFAIDDQDTSNMGLDEAVLLIRGPKGTVVKLTIWREGETKTEDVEITRDVINIKTVSWELKENKIAYLNISHFSEDTWADFQDIAIVIIKANPQGLILDLRNNPGGYLDAAVNIAGYWTGEEVIVVSKDAQGEEKKYQANNDGDLKHIPTIVLVNQGSASASEILAGALQDYKRATILGEKTFGKGSVQELEGLNDGSALKLTVAYWYTPLGRSINEEGIIPDIEIEMTDDDYLHDRDSQLSKALLMLAGELN